jgi:mono/diheme cytochrome c family protein
MKKHHWALIIVAAAALIVGIFFIPRSAQRATLDAPPQVLDTRPEKVVRGEYLARTGDCIACHTARDGAPYAGGLAMTTPFGTLYTPNITPDPETGIGKWTADEFWRALHEGKARDGSLLYPAFPFTNYTKVMREDADAMYAYFQSLRPVNRVNKPHEMDFPFNQRTLLSGWRTLYFTQGEYKEDPSKSKEWNRGAYLVEGLGHCNACHTSRNILGATRSQDEYAGGLIPVQNWYAPSLTSNREAGLGSWDTRDIVDLLRSGVSPRGAVFGPMAAVVHDSLQYLTDSDVTAMAVYLKSQGQEGQPSDPPQFETTEAQSKALFDNGKTIYEKHCVDCHQPNGEGVPRVYPPLADNQSITMDYSVNSVRMVLNGGFPPATTRNPRPYGMPPFGQDLNDQEVAAVVTYIRKAWGNKGGAVSPAEVAKSRGVAVD